MVVLMVKMDYNRVIDLEIGCYSDVLDGMWCIFYFVVGKGSNRFGCRCCIGSMDSTLVDL